MLCSSNMTKNNSKMTKCSIKMTKCSSKMSKCSSKMAKCSSKMTKCSIKRTKCSSIVTRCSSKMTKHSNKRTKCSSIEARCSSKMTKSNHCPPPPPTPQPPPAQWELAGYTIVFGVDPIHLRVHDNFLLAHVLNQCKDSLPTSLELLFGHMLIRFGVHVLILSRSARIRRKQFFTTYLA